MNPFPLKKFLLKVTKNVIVFSLCFFAGAVAADYDLSLDAGARSYPLGGALGIEGGKGLLFYGDAPSGGTDKNPWYGYLRPNAYLSTSATWSQAGAAIDVYPVSIIGVRFGTAMTSNDSDYSAYDCTNVRCQGDWSHQFARLEIILGYDIYFMVLQSRIEDWYEQKTGVGSYVEPESGLRLNAGQDRIAIQRIVVGINTSEPWTFLGMVTIYTSEKAKDRSEQFLGLALYKWDEFSLGGGAGLYGSDLKEQRVTALVRFAWTPFPSLALN